MVKQLIKLNVPIFKQEDMLACSAACLRMVLGYYGINKTENELVKSLGGLRKAGNYKGIRATKLALFARKIGFNADCYSYNTHTLDPSFARLSRNELIEKVGELDMKAKKIDEKNLIHSLHEFLKLGGNFKIEFPDKRLIINYLERKIPVIISVSSGAFFERKTDAGHFIVITGYDNGKFCYNDPAFGIKGEMDENKLLFSWYSNIIDTSAYLLAISK